jgi:hypothetical protein
LLESSPKESVEQALGTLVEPPVIVEVAADQGSWFSVVTAREKNVLWRFVCERSVWRLEAAPAWAPTESFDADLLARYFLGRGFSHAQENLAALMAITVRDLVDELTALRLSVVDGFREDSWGKTRGQLMRCGHQRDLELFGRPLPLENANKRRAIAGALSRLLGGARSRFKRVDKR